MSQARSSTSPDADGMFRVWCDPCDMEGTFPDIAMAIKARKTHICYNEAMSAQEY